MEIKTGGVYKTRDGHKARIIGENPFGGGLWIGYVEGFGHACTWDKSGYGFSSNERDLVLVEEWKEPRREKRLLLCSKENDIFFTIPVEESRFFDREIIIGSVWIEEGKWADPEDEKLYGR